MEFKFPSLKSDIKLLSWRSVMVIGLTYLFAVLAALSVSGSLYLFSESIDGSNQFDEVMKLVCLLLSYSIFIASMIGLFIKLVADSVSSAYFLKKITDTMFEPPTN